jgi:ribosomal protein S18 acetylase RimI-like enzyme
MSLRRLTRDDRVALERFLDGIPEEDRNFLKEDVTEPELRDRWLDERCGVRLGLFDDAGALEALAVLWPGVGRSAHVADLRLIVAADRRRRGLGRRMARAALIEGLNSGWRKITIEVPAGHQPTIDMFVDLGFRPEALLRDHLQEPDGRLHDLVALAHIADEGWAEMYTAGLADAAS